MRAWVYWFLVESTGERYIHVTTKAQALIYGWADHPGELFRLQICIPRLNALSFVPKTKILLFFFLNCHACHLEHYVQGVVQWLSGIGLTA